ncbi:hypothetical protein ACM66B_002800 [Microbotryomycetes sp. NB124-2]
MSSYRAQSGLSSRPSYFELYPDRVPATAAASPPAAAASSSSSPHRQRRRSEQDDKALSSPSVSSLPARTSSRSNAALPRHSKSLGQDHAVARPGKDDNQTLLARAFSPFSTANRQDAPSSPRERRVSTMAIESSSPISPPAQPLDSTNSTIIEPRRPSSAMYSQERTGISLVSTRHRSDEPPHSQLPLPSQTRHLTKATTTATHDSSIPPSTPPRKLSSRSASPGTIDIEAGPTTQPPQSQAQKSSPVPFPSMRRHSSQASNKSHTSDYDVDSAIDALIISNASRGSPSVFKTPPRSTARVQSIFPTRASPRDSPSNSIRRNDGSPPRTPRQDVFQSTQTRTPRTPGRGDGRVDLAHLPTTPVTPVFMPNAAPPEETQSAEPKRTDDDQFMAGSFATLQYSARDRQFFADYGNADVTIFGNGLHDLHTNGTNNLEETRPGLAADAPEKPADTSSTPNRIKSIDEIVRAHAGAAYVARMTPKPTPAQALAAQARARQAEEAAAAAATVVATNGSVEELAATPSSTKVASPSALEANPMRDSTKSSSGGRTRSPFSFGRRLSRPPSKQALAGGSSDDERADVKSIRSFKSSFSGYIGSRSSNSPNAFSSEALACERELALLLKSPRLTRIANMHRPPNQGLTVSYADVGAADGHPVIVFLGLGSVRYLVALFDEMAQALGLRLICLDRWGLGRTSNVSDDKRGFYEWSAIVREFAQQLCLSRYSILAHSAGAPYALATASMADDDQVFGSLHLLAPWVSTSADSLAGAYKLLKFVPSGVIKTAQAAEWKMQSWRLGKPPTIQHAAVGYNAKTGQLTTSGSGSGSLVSPSSRSVYDASDAMSTMTGAAPRTPPQYGSSRFANGGDSSFSGLVTPSPTTRRNSVASRMLSGSFLATPPSSMSSSSSPLFGTGAGVTGTDLANGLLRASHAESLRGSTADLMVILERTSKSSSTPAVRYENMAKKVKVWYGDKDERISINSIRTLEANLLGRCEVRIVEGADHNLMTNGQVMLEVLESLAREWQLHS